MLVLTTFDIDEYVYEAIRAGASGFLLKDVRPADLIDAIRLIADGNALPRADRHPPAPRPLRGPRHKRRPGDRRRPYRARARDAPAFLASGLSNAEPADRLFLSETTVKTHVSSILRKLGVRDRVQAVISAYDAGLVQPRGTREPVQ